MSLIYSFCCGNGHLSDRDTLSCDPTACRWLGIDQRPDSRRPGEYLSRFNQVGTAGWQDQLDEDVAPLLPNGTPVWMAMANAYYHKEVIHYCQDKGWDYPVSLTDSRTRRPVLEQMLAKLYSQAWYPTGHPLSDSQCGKTDPIRKALYTALASTPVPAGLDYPRQLPTRNKVTRIK